MQSPKSSSIPISTATLHRAAISPSYNSPHPSPISPCILIYNASLRSLINQTATIVGYGYTGTGHTGYSASTPSPAAHITNVFDASGAPVMHRRPAARGPTYDLTSVGSDLLLTDFDQPNNPAASIRQAPATPTPLEGAPPPPATAAGGLRHDCRTNLPRRRSAHSPGAFPDNVLSAAADGRHPGDFNGYTSLAAPRSAAFLSSNLVATASWSNPAGGT